MAKAIEVLGFRQFLDAPHLVRFPSLSDGRSVFIQDMAMHVLKCEATGRLVDVDTQGPRRQKPATRTLDDLHCLFLGVIPLKNNEGGLARKGIAVYGFYPDNTLVHHREPNKPIGAMEGD
jgi:hypothetical protein